ncbi:MAG TPA: HIT domain-containing protein [Thermoanaerobaculia bacterium]|nr:HIT domain-containing protein [Thermoanaerobaculia bacterium]
MSSPRQEQECIFCSAARAADPASTLTLFRSDRAIVMLNRYPYTNGHLMIAPIEHAARLFDSEPAVLLALVRLAAESQRILSDTYEPDGFNIGMNFGKAAGAGFEDHYHVHVVPRWGGDANFMSVTAGVRMVPETLDSTYRRLRPLFETLRGDLAGA